MTVFLLSFESLPRVPVWTGRIKAKQAVVCSDAVAFRTVGCARYCYSTSGTVPLASDLWAQYVFASANGGRVR